MDEIKYGEFTILPQPKRADIIEFEDGFKEFGQSVIRILLLLQLRPKYVGHTSNILKYDKALEGGYIKIAKNGNIRWTAKGKATLDEYMKRTARFTFTCSHGDYT